MMSSVAWPMIVAANFIERPEWEPPPAFDPIGVVGDVDDAVERHAEPFGDELGEARLMALSGRHRAHDQLDLAFGKHGDLGALARRAGGDLDIIGDADAAQLAAASRFRAAGGKAAPIGERQRRVHRLLVSAAVVGDAERVGVGLRRGRDHVPPAQRRRVEPEPVGRQIHQPLDDKDRLGPAGAAVGRGRNRVGDGAAPAKIADRDVVDVRHQAEALLQRPEGDGMPAEIAQIGAANSKEIAVLVESELGRRRSDRGPASR